MRVTKATVRRQCAVCERTLLQGEYALRFSPDGLEFVDVCPLCQDVALEYGWVREGGPISPALSPHGRPAATALGSDPRREVGRDRAGDAGASPAPALRR